ncbi:WXG100-like domain-containing protein [Kitasatospora griseola]|uniref:WXG100-like domain-containing protein n=1 Tax=Kitasatospora griseola TaxID=2064 RepID=UPI0038245774
MAIELPGELVWVMDLLGFNWPEVNEDKVREFAGHVRQFATNVDSTHETASAIIRQMAEHYQADSYGQLVERWTAMSNSHMDEIVQVCGVVGTVLEVAADAIVAAKLAVITQLGIAAAELVAAAATAVATLGVSAAAEAALIEVTKRVVNQILQEVEQQIIGELVSRAIEPLEGVVERAVSGLVFKGVQAALDGAMSGGGPGGGGFRINPDELLRLSAALHDHSEQVAGHVSAFASATSGVSFS